MGAISGPLNRLPLVDLSRRLADREISSEAVVSDCLARIAERDGEVGAWEYLDPDRALEQARQRDREAPRSPLHGVPVGIKDVIDVAGMPAAWGDQATYGHRRPKRNAPIIRRLQDLGVVILGKTAVSRFGFWWPGKTRNPLALDRTPGSSSSGSAAAIADLMCPLAIGTQTGGSIIRPAAFCGVVGVLPSYDWIAWRSSRDFAPTFDVSGFFTRSLPDARLALDCLAGYSAAPDRIPERLRIGLYRTSHWDDVPDYVRSNFETAAGLLAKAGHIVETWAAPDEYEALYDAQHLIVQYESFRHFEWELDQQRLAIDPGLTALLEEGGRIDDAAYFSAIGLHRRLKTSFASDLGAFDLLMVPGSEGEAPDAASCGGNRFIRQWMMLHAVDISVPFGQGPSGMPLSIQLVGKTGSDRHHLAKCLRIRQSLAASGDRSGSDQPL